MEHINFILYGVNHSNLEMYMYIEDGEDTRFQEFWMLYSKILNVFSLIICGFLDVLLCNR